MIQAAISPPLHTIQLGKSWFSPTSGGGLDRMFDGLMRHFPTVGVEAQGFVAGPPRLANAPEGIQGVCEESTPIIRRGQAFRTAVRAVLAETPSPLVAAHFAVYAAPVLDLLGGLPFVFHFHGPWGLESEAEGESWWKIRAKTMLEQAVYSRAQHFIVLSEAFRDVLTTNYGIPRNRISIVPGGVDLNRYNVGLSRQEACHHLDLPLHRPTVVSVRRLARRMGLERLLEAWAEVCAHHPEALLLIAGKGPLQVELQEHIDRLGLNQNARLLGFVPDEDLPYLYRAADLSVLPTIALEGFGLTTIESLAAGTPALVTPVGGLPEVVRDLSANLVLPDASTDALAKGLTVALDNPDALPSPAECQSFVDAHYSWPVIAAQTRDVYETVYEMSA
jgi:glycosyltransferase involved in cell wall biosynthesis